MTDSEKQNERESISNRTSAHGLCYQHLSKSSPTMKGVGSKYNNNADEQQQESSRHLLKPCDELATNTQGKSQRSPNIDWYQLRSLRPLHRISWESRCKQNGDWHSAITCCTKAEGQTSLGHMGHEINKGFLFFSEGDEIS